MNKFRIAFLSVMLCVSVILAVFTKTDDKNTAINNDADDYVDVFVLVEKSWNGERQYTREFDKNGNMLRYVKYLDNGSEYDLKLYEYDKNNNLINELKQYTEDSVKNSVKRTFDDQNRLKTMTNYTDGVTNNRVEYEYDSSGNLIKRIDYDKTGEYDRHFVYEYDSFNNKISETCYRNENISYRYTWKYDEQGNELEYKKFSGDNELLSRKKEYDESGNCLSIIWHNKGEFSSGIYFTYDEKGNITERREVNPNGPEYRSAFGYDEKGNRISYVKFVDGKKTEYHYTVYDSYGNIMSSEGFDDGKTTKQDYKYEYNKFGKKERQEYYKDSVLQSVTDYNYYSDGTLKESVSKPSEGEQAASTVLHYDRYGNMVKRVVSFIYNGKNVVRTEELKYIKFRVSKERAEIIQSFIDKLEESEKIQY